MSGSRLCIDTKTYLGKRIVFEEMCWRRKAKRRPELLEDGMLRRIEETLRNPDLVFRDHANPEGRRCYYREEYRVNGRPRYIKVVATNTTDPLYIITAYRPDRIKELQYGLKPIWETR